MDVVAYVCRYGRQSRNEVMTWTLPELREFRDALTRIVERENEPEE